MDKYTKFILTVIAVAMIGILFKGEIIKSAQAIERPLRDLFVQLNENNKDRAYELELQHNDLARQIKDQCG